MSRRFDLTILTADKFLDPGIQDSESVIASSEHRLMQEALDKVNISHTVRSWSDPHFDWPSTRYAIFRTTWDYFEKLDHFIRWMGRTSKQTNFINEFKLTQWNLDKHYLLDLHSRGIPIVPTHFLKPLTRTSLREELVNQGWERDAILKPSISASSKHTYHLKESNIENHEGIFQRLLRSESLMLQPFIQSVVDKGEISLMVMDGKFSHAVIKRPKFGDFRVQSDFGGTAEKFLPDTSTIEMAEKVVEACPIVPVYARVDFVWDKNGDLLLSELELIEPELFLRYDTESPGRLAKAIEKHINKS